jgi:chromosomal replication initiator protein
MYSTAYVWAKILHYLEQRLTEVFVASWFDDAEVLEFSNDRLVLYSPSEYRQEIIRSRGEKYIKDAMKELFNLDITLTVLGDDDLDEYNKTKRKMDFLDFNPQFTFDTFVVGSSNQFAHAAALAVALADDTIEEYNPLFIYGPPGLGKTHLLYAIADKVHQKNPDSNIVYVKAVQFTTELIEAIKVGNTAAFREKYQSADLLLVDDVQFIAGKDSTQEEYFHTFNALYENRKRIVMTADRPPESMSKLEERLRTRFSWGLTTEISPPDYETRMAILRSYAMNAGVEVPDEAFTFIAENVTTDVRRLEGAINKLKAVVSLEGGEIDMNRVSRVLKNLKPDEKSLPTPSLIVAEVCRFYSLDESTLRSNNKSKIVSEARQVAMYLLQSMLGLSTPQIGQELGRDHATVVYGTQKIKEMLLKPNAGIGDNLRDITSNINGRL